MKTSIIKDKRKGLFTLKELAKEMNVSVETIKRWQNKSYSPNCEQVIQLSNLLGVGIRTIVLDYINKEEGK